MKRQLVRLVTEFLIITSLAFSAFNGETTWVLALGFLLLAHTIDEGNHP